MQIVNLIALILLLVGGINWGLVGLINLDLVAAIFGPGSGLARIVYILIGVASVYSIILLKPMLKFPPR
ncbi:MAG: DUF378 domain-containing protein [Alphaproteobacteria bacterium]